MYTGTSICMNVCICVYMYIYVYVCMYIYVCMGDNCICIYRSIYVGIYRRFSSYTTFGSAVPSMYGKYSLCARTILSLTQGTEVFTYIVKSLQVSTSLYVYNLFSYLINIWVPRSIYCSLLSGGVYPVGSIGNAPM